MTLLVPVIVDATAIHDNVAGEINAITEKITPVNADLVLIEDSANGNAKKRVQVGNLPGGAGGDTLPVPDTTAVVKGSVDATKQVRIEADGLTAGITRVLTMPDADITPDDQGASRAPSGVAGGDLSGAFPNPTVDKIEGVDISAVAPTVGQVLTATSGTAANWQTAAVGLGYVLDWGAGMSGAPKFPRSFGTPAGNPTTAQDPRSEITIIKPGTITAFAWNTAGADATTVMKIHVNQVVVATLALTGLVGTITGLSVAVVLGDEVSIEYDAGKAPANTNCQVYIE